MTAIKLLTEIIKALVVVSINWIICSIMWNEIRNTLMERYRALSGFLNQHCRDICSIITQIQKMSKTLVEIERRVNELEGKKPRETIITVPISGEGGE